jgi:hypothetical protein
LPVVGVTNVPLYERLIFGHDGSDYRVVKVDGSGNLVAAVLADQNIQAYAHGYVGAAWQKDAMRVGYSGTVSELKTDLNASAGNNTLASTAVPAGEIWTVQAIHAYNLNRAATTINIYATVGGIAVYLATGAPDAVSLMSHWSGAITLEENDTLSALFTGTVLDDDLYFGYLGMRTDIDL